MASKANRSLIDVDSRLGIDGITPHLTRSFESCKIGFLSDDDVKRIATCNITHSEVFDDMGGILSNGLHDKRMGLWKDFSDEPCPTCKFSVDQGCCGHYGKMQLIEPVFNPFLFKEAHR